MNTNFPFERKLFEETPHSRHSGLKVNDEKHTKQLIFSHKTLIICVVKSEARDTKEM